MPRIVIQGQAKGPIALLIAIDSVPTVNARTRQYASDEMSHERAGLVVALMQARRHTEEAIPGWLEMSFEGACLSLREAILLLDGRPKVGDPGDAVRAVRHAMGLSQKQLAAMLDMKPSTLNRIEKGVPGSPLRFEAFVLLKWWASRTGASDAFEIAFALPEADFRSKVKPKRR